jgi:hypothetical protein
LLFDMMQRQDRMGGAGSARDLARSIEETISDSLIAARTEAAALSDTAPLSQPDNRKQWASWRVSQCVRNVAEQQEPPLWETAR